MNLFRLIVLLCCLWSSPLCAQQLWNIHRSSDDGAQQFAAEEIAEALHSQGISTRMQALDGEITSPSIILGIADSRYFDQFLESGRIDVSGLKPEGFVIRSIEFDGKPVVLALGRDRRGCMYAGLEVAEQISLGILPADISDMNGNPHVAFRGVKTNLPWEPYQRGESTDVNNQEFRNLDTWREYLQVLARGRINVLTLWSLNPFEFMVEVDKYPEASRYSHAEMRDWISFWKSLFKMADDYCIDTYIVNWNINIPSGLSSHHGIPRQNQDSPLVRDYLREATRALIDTYEDLTGFGITTGEEMEGFTPEQSAQFVEEVYFAGLKQARRQVPFIHRSWATTTPASIRTLLSKVQYPAPVYVDLKFNVSHGLSSPRAHFTNFRGHEWADLWEPPSPDYKMVWHVRNEEVYLLHWADPDFVREHVKTNAKPHAIGYFFGPERHLPFLEPWHRQDDGHGQTRWEFRRRWYLPTLWGRLGYSPDLPNSHFGRLFDLHYGDVVGSELLEGLMHGSRAILNFLRLHPGGNDVSVYAEGAVGNGTFEGYRSGRGPRFISVLDLIFYISMDDHVVDIPTSVNRALKGEAQAQTSLSPLQLADEFEQDGEISGEVAARLLSSSLSPLARCMVSDLVAYQHLNRYFAEKVRGAVFLYRFLRTGSTEDHSASIEHLEKAAKAWEDLAEVTSTHYSSLIADVIGLYHWNRYTPHARHDVEIASRLVPLRNLSQIMTWQISQAFPSTGRAELFDRGFEESDLAVWKELPHLSLNPNVFESEDVVVMAQEMEKLDEVRVDLSRSLPDGSSGALLRLVYNAEQSRNVTAHLSTQDYMRVMVNGREVFKSDTITRELARPGYDLDEKVYSRMLGSMISRPIPDSANHFGGAFQIPLEKGENEVLFLLDPSGVGRRTFTFRLRAPFETLD